MKYSELCAEVKSLEARKDDDVEVAAFQIMGTAEGYIIPHPYDKLAKTQVEGRCELGLCRPKQRCYISKAVFNDPDNWTSEPNAF